MKTFLATVLFCLGSAILIGAAGAKLIDDMVWSLLLSSAVSFMWTMLVFRTMRYFHFWHAYGMSMKQTDELFAKEK